MNGAVFVQQLVQQAKRGDKQAEEELIRFLLPKFHYLASRRVGPEDASDIAHDACLTVIEKYRSHASDDDFLSWAYMILKNKIGNYYQARSVRKKYMRQREPESPETGSHNANPDILLRHDIRRCLKKLVDRFPRYAEALHYTYTGYATTEICRMMSITPANLYVLLNRGRSLLSACLQDGKLQ
jgi:RNA polymerase sigma-70 factor (ECF subfamily)